MLLIYNLYTLIKLNQKNLLQKEQKEISMFYI